MNEQYKDKIEYYTTLLMRGNKDMTKEEAMLTARQVVSNLNITFVLADTLNSFMIDTETGLSKMGLTLSHEDKHRFLLMMKAIKSAKNLTSGFARPLYGIVDADDACQTSDWYYNFIKLVEDKITDKQRTHDILKMLFSMESETPLYNVTAKDFS